MESYDVIIIGSGAGGGTLARHLAPSGKRILLLERGDWLPREPQNWSDQDVFVDNRYVSAGHLVRRERQAVPAAGPLLRRRRDEALRRGPLPASQGGLRRAAATTTASRRPGRSPTTSSSPTTRWPSSSTRCTARAARTRPSRPRARRTRIPPCRTSRGSSSSRTTSRPPGYRPFHAPCGDPAQRVEPAVHRPASAVRPATASRASCTRSRTPRCSAFGRRSSTRTSTLLTNARVVRLETNGAGTAVTRGRRRARRRPRSGSPPTSSCVACGAANTAKLLLAVGERQAPERSRQRLRPGRPQLHVPRLDGRARALARGEPDRLSEDARAERLLLRRTDDFEYPLGNIQMVGKSRRRCSAASDRGTRSSRPSGRWSGWRAMRSTSGSPPRTCRDRRTASPSSGTATSR